MYNKTKKYQVEIPIIKGPTKSGLFRSFEEGVGVEFTLKWHPVLERFVSCHEGQEVEITLTIMSMEKFPGSRISQCLRFSAFYPQMVWDESIESHYYSTVSRRGTLQFSCRDLDGVVKENLNTIFIDADLSVRLVNCLQKAGLRTFRDVVMCNKNDIANIPKLGRTSFRELEKKLKVMGLAFGMDVSEFDE